MTSRNDHWEDRALFRTFSSRIANLYIQLPDYEYFHGPSGLEGVDKRFVGRREVIAKIKRLLTDRGVSSGAYLVTGYRGAGKSSAVATALAAVSSQESSPTQSQYLRIFIWSAALLVVNHLLPPNYSQVFTLLFALLLVTALVLLWRKRDSRAIPSAKPSRRTRIRQSMYLIVDDILRVKGAQGGDRLRDLLADLSRVAILFLSTTACISLLDQLRLQCHILLYCTRAEGTTAIYGFGIFGATSLLYWLLSIRHRIRDPWQPPGHPARLRDWILNRWSNSNRMIIRINLSQDDIKEVDILRLLVSNLLSAYTRYLRSLKGMLAPASGIALAFVAATFIFNTAEVHHLVNSLKLSINLPTLAPSQGEFLLDSKQQDERGNGSGYLGILHEALDDPNSIDSLRKRLSEVARTNGSHPQAFLNLFDHEQADDAGLLASLGSAGLDLAAHFDSLLQLAYSSSVDSLLGLEPNGWASRRFDNPLLRRDMFFFPRLLDYTYLVFLVLVAYVAKAALDSGLTSWETNQRVVRALRELNEMVEAQVTRDAGSPTTPVSTFMSISFGRKRSQTFPQLSARDIEKNLLDIMRRIHDLPPFSRRPNFVIIFDELDKIHNTTAEIESREASPTSAFSSVEAERERQHRVLKLVSNLKYFLTTAPAKFIFIAGREMFDASLADVSDRHFFMGSVFHEVIHVPSFHRDPTDGRLPDLASLTEEYVARMLLPAEHWPRDQSGRVSLAIYGEYLKQHVLSRTYYAAGSEQTTSAGDERFRRALAEKILYELRNFVIYLTYRSNGAPKKMTQAFERFIVGADELTSDMDQLIVGDGSRQSLYLRFIYEDQYSFGLITYLASPLLFSLSREMKDYGDKILVSSSFLLDHIYKFHGMGFSWRNLELLPEIVDASRAPQLRGLVRRLVSFLCKSDMVAVDNGLYDFKFTRRVSEEISLLSRISEFESAAFNFTLDESMALKHHFQQKLDRLISSYGVYPNRKRNQRHIFSLGFLRMVLGDLHFYDGDLDNAIIEYMEAVQSIRETDIGKADIGIVLLMARNFLKLALTYERKKSLSSALAVYSKMIAAICSYTGASESKSEIRSSDSVIADQKTANLEILRIIYLPVLAKLQLIEKLGEKGLRQGDIDRAHDELRSLLGPGWTENGDAEIVFQRKLGNILFLKNGPRVDSPKPHCLQNQSLCKRNIDWQGLSRNRKLPCIACSHYSGSIRTWSNSSPTPGIARPKTTAGIILSLLDSEHTSRDWGSSSSIAAFAEALSYQGDCFVSCGSMDSADDREGTGPNLAVLLAPLLDCFSEILRLSQEGRDIHLTERDREIILACAGRTAHGEFQRARHKIAEACCYYLASAAIFGLTARYREANLEIVKVLWLIRESISLARSGSRLRSDRRILATLVRGVEKTAQAGIRLAYRCHEGTHRLEIEYLKEIVLGDDFKESARRNPVNLGRLSINVTLGEILVLRDEIALLLEPRTLPLRIDRRCAPFGMIHSAYTRIQELRLRLSINRHNFRCLCSALSQGIPYDGDRKKLPGLRQRREEVGRIFGEPLPKLPSEMDQGLKVWATEFRFKPEQAQAHAEPTQTVEAIFGATAATVSQAVEFLLLDSLYCCHETVRLMSIFGGSYISSFSMRASAHRNFAWWCDAYYEYWKLLLESGREEQAKDLVQSVRDHLGPAELVVLTPNFHREMAKAFYVKSLEAHSEGEAYKDRIQDSYLLWDDCADHLEHFCAALERLRINSGYMDRKLRALDALLIESKVSQIDQYSVAAFASLHPDVSTHSVSPRRRK